MELPANSLSIGRGSVNYDQEFGTIKFTNRRKDGVLRKAYMDSKGSVEIQKKAAKLLKVTTIVPYRPVSGPIIKEIDDD